MRREWLIRLSMVIMVPACEPHELDGGATPRSTLGQAAAPSCPLGTPVGIPVYKGDPRLPSDQASICLQRLEDKGLAVVVCGEREVVMVGPRKGFLGDRYLSLDEGELHWIDIFSPKDGSEPFATDWVLPACRDQIKKPDHSGGPFACPQGYFAAEVKDYRQAMQSFLGGHYDTVAVCVPEGQGRFQLTEYTNGWGYRFEQGSVGEVRVGCNGRQDVLSFETQTSFYTNMSTFATDDGSSRISIRFEAPRVDDPSSAPESVTAERATVTTDSWGSIHYCQ